MSKGREYVVSLRIVEEPGTLVEWYSPKIIQEAVDSLKIDRMPYWRITKRTVTRAKEKTR